MSVFGDSIIFGDCPSDFYILFGSISGEKVFLKRNDFIDNVDDVVKSVKKHYPELVVDKDIKEAWSNCRPLPTKLISSDEIQITFLRSQKNVLEHTSGWWYDGKKWSASLLYEHLCNDGDEYDVRKI